MGKIIQLPLLGTVNGEKAYIKFVKQVKEKGQFPLKPFRTEPENISLWPHLFQGKNASKDVKYVFDNHKVFTKNGNHKILLENLSKTQQKYVSGTSKILGIIANTSWKTVGAGAAIVGLGVLIANLIAKNKDKKAEVAPPEQQEPPVKTGRAEVTKTEKAQYHTINNKGLTWSNIVNAYYPDLVEQCGGKMYGKDGAIRQLKIALSKDMGIDLINETAIPKTLNLPFEINGVQIKKDAVPTHSKCEQGGHTDIEEAGAKPTKKTYKAVDKENNAEFEWEKYPDVIDSLKVRTGVDEYEVKADTLSVVA